MKINNLLILHHSTRVQVRDLLDLDLRSGSGVRKKGPDRTWTGPWTV